MESKGECERKRKRRNKWTPEAEKILFVVWARNLSGLRLSRMNHPVFVKMSHEMDALGYPYTVKEIKTKTHNLASRYRDERKLMRECGVRPAWAHYQTVHNIYGKGRVFRSEPESEESADDNSSDRNLSVRSEGIDVDYSSDNSNEDSTDEAVITCMETMNRNMISLIEHTHEQNKKSLDLQREMLEIQKERNEILVKMLDVFKNKWKKKTANEENAAAAAAAKKLKLSGETNAVAILNTGETNQPNGSGNGNGSWAVAKVLPIKEDTALPNESNLNTSNAVGIISEIPNA